MNTGEIKWEAPVGEVKRLAEQGITDTGAGMRVRGGPAVTAGDLIFQSASDKLYAFDRETGALLWSHPLPGLGEGIPSVYAWEGRQYVAVVATAGRSVPPADGVVRNPSYIAFTLP